MLGSENKKRRYDVSLNDPVYSGRNFRSCWEFVLRHGDNVDGFFSGINIPRSRILNENEWFTIEVAEKIWKNYRSCIPGYNMCDNYQIGLEALQTAAYGAAIIAAQLSPIRMIVKRVPNLVSAVSKIDFLDVLELGKGTGVVGYRIHGDFEEYLDSSFTNQFLGTLAGIPTIHGMPPADVREVASCIDVFKKFNTDFKEFGHHIEGHGDAVILDGKTAGRWIRIGKERAIHPIAAKHLEDERCVLWERDVMDKTLSGREVTIARKGDLYNCSKSLFYMHWQEAPPTKRLKNFIDGFSNYVVALSKSRDLLIQRANSLQENARILEKRVVERTHQLREAQVKLIKAEKRTLEHRITGGFAHEMMNVLTGAQMELKATLDYQNQKRSSVGFLKDAATSVLQNISALQKEFQVPREFVATRFVSSLETIYEIADQLSSTISNVADDLERAVAITNQIRDYAKMQEMTPGNDRVDLVSTLAEYKDRFRQDFEKLKIDCHVKGAQRAVITADKVHLDSIFGNLILNAKDALTECGPERKRKILVEVNEAEGEEQMLTVKIADNGSGISSKDLREIFEPFFTTKSKSGTGLGLSVVKRLLELYRWDIDVSSTVGEGTLFTITLPKRHEQAVRVTEQT